MDPTIDSGEQGTGSVRQGDGGSVGTGERNTPRRTLARDTTPTDGTIPVEEVEREPDPIPGTSSKVTRGDKTKKGRSTTTTRRVTYELLSRKGAEKLALLFTTIVEKRFGDKWRASQEELELLGDSLEQTVTPFPIVSSFIAKYAAPAVLAGTILGYVLERRRPGFALPRTVAQPTPQRVQPAPQTQVQPQQVQPQTAQPVPQPTNGKTPVYSNVVEAAPLVSAMDN